MCVCLVTSSCLTLVTPRTVAPQAPLSMGFPRQEYWSGLPFLSLGDLPDPEIKTMSPEREADSLPPSHQGSQKVNGQKVKDIRALGSDPGEK